uniref:ARAD1D17424p n=1 Tax=Blastobotrys adeninivorans TaxID=409370 RepID=A0A060T9U9_BLAAD
MKVHNLVLEGVFLLLSILSDVVRSILAVLIALLTFLPYSAFMGVRYCIRRRRHPEQFAPPPVARAYRVRTRRKKPKLMHIDGVNEKFPTMTFKEARIERPHIADDNLPKVEPDSTRQDQQSTDAIIEVGTDSHHEDGHEKKVAGVDTREVSPEANNNTSHDAFEKNPDLEAQTHTQHHETSSVNDSVDSEEGDEEIIEDSLDDVDSDDTCAVCLEQMEDMESVRLLTCGHIFHAECIDPWFTMRRACCPLCKADYYDVNYDPEQNNEQEQQNNAAQQEAQNTQPPRRRDRVWTALLGNNIGPTPSESDATRRRRAAAIHNIWGARHPAQGENAHVHTTRRSDAGAVGTMPAIN